MNPITDMDRTILVVDDMAANRNLLRETLEPEGYEVLLAGDGATALKVMGRARPQVVLLDVNMPDMDGYEVCRRLKDDPSTAEIPVIFITANDDAHSLVKGFKAGGVDFVAKPFKSEEVLMRLNTHLRIAHLTRTLAQKNDDLEAEVGRRRAAEDKAIAANEAKSRFLSFISHEMRAPLNAIIGFSEELSDALNEAGAVDACEDAGRIRSAGGHLLGLINNLLDLSKIEAGKMPLVVEPFGPGNLVSELAKDVAPLVRRNGNSLSVNCDAGIGETSGDATKLRQVLMNLIGNAAKFTSEGEIRLTVSLDGEGGNMLYRVSDTGIGMTETEMGRLFKAYQQANDSTSKNFGGTGLGLAISREFCRLMGGDLTVDSEKGKGATFTARIPVQVEPVHETAVPGGLN